LKGKIYYINKGIKSQVLHQQEKKNKNTENPQRTTTNTLKMPNQLLKEPTPLTEIN